MAAWNCGWCGTFGEMKPTGESWITPFHVAERLRNANTAGPGAFYSTFTCGKCSEVSFGVIARESIHRYEKSTDGIADFWRKNEPEKTFPQWVETPTYEAIPEYLVEPVKEAHETQAMGFYRSSVILARAVIEATAKDRGADGRDLYQRIKKLREMELITPLTESGAHIVRDSGNNMAHGDFEEEVDWELAEATLEFMGFVLADVYVAPARVKAMEARIEASKAAQRNAKLEESSS